MYDVRPSGAGCGLGCFAARDIVKGETIMEEAPLLRWSMARTAEGAEGQAVPTAAPRSSTMASLGRRADAGELPSSLQSTLRGLEGALAALDPDSRAAFFALSHQNKEETATAAAQKDKRGLWQYCGEKVRLVPKAIGATAAEVSEQIEAIVEEPGRCRKMGPSLASQRSAQCLPWGFWESLAPPCREARVDAQQPFSSKHAR